MRWSANVLLLIVALSSVSCQNSSQVSQCKKFYEQGVESYLGEHWSECIEKLESGIKLYKEFNKKLAKCRLECKYQAQNSDPMFSLDIENLQFYEHTVRNTLCLLKCTDGKHSVNDVRTLKDAQEIYDERKPYEYLHVCYFQKMMFNKAASAAFTFLVMNQKNEMMTLNLKYYISLPEVDEKEITNFDVEEHVYLYTHGTHAYDKKEWKETIENMEESLINYLRSEEECRAKCEGPFESGWQLDFMPAVANHFTFVLKCKQRCSILMNNLNGKYYDDLLPSHYHYMQFAYYKVGDLKAACRAAISYMLFYPTDETMFSNIEYYKKMPKVQEDYFIPREEAIKYVQRSKYEKSLLKFIDKEFQPIIKKRIPKKPEANRHFIVSSSRSPPNSIQISSNETDLNGKNRLVLDGLLDGNQCRILSDIADMYAVPGDGYNGNKFPFTRSEIFSGFTITRATLLVYFGLMKSETLLMYLRLTEMVKVVIEKTFNIQKPLYFTYTHLVCRTSQHDSSKPREDLSHPIHADNCNLKINGDCEKQFPAYTWRDYTAILYLNENFEGGDFFFTAGPRVQDQVQSTVKPRCGRMIAFSAGSENKHGVKPILRGKRCAIGIWMTFNSSHVEIERNYAHKLLEAIHKNDVMENVYEYLKKKPPN